MEEVMATPLNITDENAWLLRIRLPKEVFGLTKDSEVLIEQIIAWDHQLFKKDLGLLPDAFTNQIRGALREFLDV